MTPGAVELLCGAARSGNVRQLINALEYAFITSRGAEIDIPDLPAYLASEPARSRLPRRRAACTREAVRDALERAGGSRTEAARVLGISRVTLWKKMREWGL